MNTSSFLAGLRLNPTLPLVFRAGPDIVPPGYHLTEVKRVTYETMDCGATTHQWRETQFEVWAPALASITSSRGHMAAEKFLQIIDRVEAELPLNGEATARIHASLGVQPAALYDIDAVDARDGRLWIELTPERTRCKAAERRLAPATGGCCGSGSGVPEKEESGTGCGCGSAKAGSTATVCCA